MARDSAAHPARRRGWPRRSRPTGDSLGGRRAATGRRTTAYAAISAAPKTAGTATPDS
ncbi:hypothetical protein LUX09_32585 [Streptomyces albogriseolus]|nr:hypothetical protein [Streptomyces albogriseolus]